MAFLRGILVLISIIGLAIAGLVFAFSDPDMPADILVTKYGAPPSQFIDLPSGAKVHYRDQGQKNGMPLVLLHGSNASLHTWEPWAGQLGDQFRIISVDLPGHGLTGAVPGDDYSQEGMAKFVDLFTRAMGVQRFALAGNSMGGGVAARFALMHPERLTHVILVDAGGMPTKTPQDPGLGFRIARMPVIQNVLLFVSPRSLFEDGLKKAIVDDALVTPEMIDRYWELNRRAGTRAASLKRFQTPFDTVIADNVSKIATPTLILWGELDTLTPRDMGDAYNAAIKGSRFIVYKNVGHLPMEEAAEQSARAVREFLYPTPLPPQD
ncbi:MAG: alpha/beta hydrolase [Alphaproteobacteria bacterium]|nr:alpha/beta hydrolase [Alphaproteobacteria bacterium]